MEQRSIDWLHNNLGGDIIVLRPSSFEGQKISDLLWRGKPLELKHVTGNLTSMDKSIQRGLKQTNGGGILLDVTGAKFSDQDATEKAINRLVRKGFGYVIMIRDNNLVSYIYRE